MLLNDDRLPRFWELSDNDIKQVWGSLVRELGIIGGAVAIGDVLENKVNLSTKCNEWCQDDSESFPYVLDVGSIRPELVDCFDKARMDPSEFAHGLFGVVRRGQEISTDRRSNNIPEYLARLENRCRSDSDQNKSLEPYIIEDDEQVKKQVGKWLKLWLSYGGMDSDYLRVNEHSDLLTMMEASYSMLCKKADLACQVDELPEACFFSPEKRELPVQNLLADLLRVLSVKDLLEMFDLDPLDHSICCGSDLFEMHQNSSFMIIPYFVLSFLIEDRIGHCVIPLLHSTSFPLTCNRSRNSYSCVAVFLATLSSSSPIFKRASECQDRLKHMLDPYVEKVFFKEIQQKISRHEGVVAGGGKAKKHFAHTLNTPLQALNHEPNLTENGRWAIDYIMLWQRFVQNSLRQYELPMRVSEAFDNDDAFLSRVLSLSLERLCQENRTPSYLLDDEPVFISVDLLLVNKRCWLRLYSLELDPAWVWIDRTFCSRERATAKKMLKALLLTEAIGCFHHILSYVFYATDKDDNGSVVKIFSQCDKGMYSVSCQGDENELVISIRNSGHEKLGKRMSTPAEELRGEKVGSSNLGVLEWDVAPKKWKICLHKFVKSEHLPKNEDVWLGKNEDVWLGKITIERIQYEEERG